MEAISPEQPRELEGEQTISVGRGPSIHFASELSPSWSQEGQTDQNRKPEYCRAGQVTSGRTVSSPTAQATLRTFHPSRSTRLLLFPCQYRNPSWKVSVSRYELGPGKRGIGRQWY